ncbi:MAG: hypothetical protein IPO94_06850 [Saprospiraceae bacterium]|nr:hypothetical protein [Saprospiraceae bacterium]
MSTQVKAPAVNYIRHIDIFFEIVRISPAINYAHIAVYISLFRFWNQAFFSNPITPTRSEIMIYASIKSKECYYKILREISELDLIRYYPSKSRYETGQFCMSKLEYVDNFINISVWAISNHETLNGTKIEIPFPELKKSSSTDNRSYHHKTQLINGRGIILMEKSVKLSLEPVDENVEIQHPSYNPLTDPKYASHIDNRISSPSNISNYANRQDSQSRGAGLRPSGVPVDPEADYSIKL